MAKYEQWLTDEGLIKIEGWAKDGLTDEQIAKNMGIRTSTIYEWKKKFPEITEALKKGKEVIDREVENKLYQRAVGYEYKETKKIVDADGKKRIEEVTKQVPPDTTAQIFWLKNRKPDTWRDKQRLEHTGKDGEAIQVESVREKIESRISSVAAKIGEGEDTE